MAQTGVHHVAHRETVEADVADITRYLEDTLGPKLVAHLAGVENARTVARWANGERRPRTDSEERLRCAYYVFRILNEVESSHTVRAWFAGMNPLLDEKAPVGVIRAGRFEDVVAAAKAFVADG